MSKPMNQRPLAERRSRLHRSRGILGRIGTLVSSQSRFATLGGVTGFAAGATSGIMAGTPGFVVGAILGTAIGATAGAALGAGEEEKRRVDRELDSAGEPEKRE
jgi:hypothetical protein